MLFREVNERIREAAERANFPGPTVFVCECGREDCSEPIELTLEEYEDVRAFATRFAVAPGHELTEYESVVDRRDRFAIVDKEDRAGEVAEQNDPRA